MTILGIMMTIVLRLTEAGIICLFAYGVNKTEEPDDNKVWIIITLVWVMVGIIERISLFS